MFLLKRPAIWFWCVACVLVPPLGIVAGSFGAYFAARSQDRNALYAYVAVLFIAMLWLSWVLEGTIAI